MATATLSINLKPGQSVEQQLNRRIDEIEEPEKMKRFLESMSDELDDPSNFLGFIYQRVSARKG
jgi:hypothetical protein